MNNPLAYRKALTKKIIEAIENGTAPWVKPWDVNKPIIGMPFNVVSERSYHGGNSLWLQCQAFDDPRWCTYKQAQEQGWQVIRGEKATVVEYWQWDKVEKDAAGKSVTVKLEQPRVYYAHVFNLQQMRNAPTMEQQLTHEWQPEEQADWIIKNANPKIIHDQQNQAFYSPTKDEIHLPAKELFHSSKAYYSTALHELGHWSGHSTRLNRDLLNQFGSQEYAREELRAELSSFFISNRIGIPHDPSQHAAYIESWIKVLRKDHNEIFRAAKDAEQITEFVLQFQQENHLDKNLMNEATLHHEEVLEC